MQTTVSHGIGVQAGKFQALRHRDPDGKCVNRTVGPWRDTYMEAIADVEADGGQINIHPLMRKALGLS